MASPHDKAEVSNSVAVMQIEVHIEKPSCKNHMESLLDGIGSTKMYTLKILEMIWFSFFRGECTRNPPSKKAMGKGLTLSWAQVKFSSFLPHLSLEDGCWSISRDPTPKRSHRTGPTIKGGNILRCFDPPILETNRTRTSGLHLPTMSSQIPNLETLDIAPIDLKACRAKTIWRIWWKGRSLSLGPFYSKKNAKCDFLKFCNFWHPRHIWHFAHANSQHKQPSVAGSSA